MGSSLMSRLNGRLLFSFYCSALSVADVDSGFVENFTIRRLKKKNKKCILSCPSRQVWAEGRPTKAKTLYRFCFPSAKLDVNRLVFALVWFTTRCNRSNYIRVMRVSREGAVLLPTCKRPSTSFRSKENCSPTGHVVFFFSFTYFFFIKEKKRVGNICWRGAFGRRLQHRRRLLYSGQNLLLPSLVAQLSRHGPRGSSSILLIYLLMLWPSTVFHSSEDECSHSAAYPERYSRYLSFDIDTATAKGELLFERDTRSPAATSLCLTISSPQAAATASLSTSDKNHLYTTGTLLPDLLPTSSRERPISGALEFIGRAIESTTAFRSLFQIEFRVSVRMHTNSKQNVRFVLPLQGVWSVPSALVCFVCVCCCCCCCCACCSLDWNEWGWRKLWLFAVW